MLSCCPSPDREGTHIKKGKRYFKELEENTEIWGPLLARVIFFLTRSLVKRNKRPEIKKGSE